MTDLRNAGTRSGNRGGRIAPETPGRGTTGALLLAVTILSVGMAPAHAQRIGRRFRQPPPAPRATAPARPTPGAAAPGAAPARAPTPAPGQKNAGAGSKEKPQTTATPARRDGQPSPADPARPEGGAAIAAADVAWDGVVPFGPEWRRSHPTAWRADDDAGAILLTAAAEAPTRVDRPAAVAAVAAAPRSVLEPTAKEPELLVFPAASAGATAEAEGPAADGTVSVLARDAASDREREPKPSAGEGSVIAGGDEQRGSPWLSLGAFAAVPEGHAAEPIPHVFLELSLHRDGTVRGNYYDALSDAVQPVTGRVDRDAGTLAWRVGTGPEFHADADGLAAGRARATVRKGSTERTWTLIALD